MPTLINKFCEVQGGVCSWANNYKMLNVSELPQLISFVFFTYCVLSYKVQCT